MGKTTVVYNDVAVGSADSAQVTTTGALDGSLPQDLPFGRRTGKVMTLERHGWILDGTFDTFFRETSPGFWSAHPTDAECCFQTDHPVITIAFPDQISSLGITIVFDEDTGDYCSRLNIRWYQGDTLKADVDFNPDDQEYFCSQRVESYDKVEVTLLKTSLPMRRAKISKILFGSFRSFGPSELMSAAATNEMNTGMLELTASTFRWTLCTRKPEEFIFQKRQPVEIYNLGRLLGVYYIDSAKRTSKNTYSVESSDVISVLDDAPFSGGAYLTGVSARELLDELAAPFPVTYADDVQDRQLKGVITSGSKRAAIQQVLFAWGVCAATDGVHGLRVFSLPEYAIEIPADRIYTGLNVTQDSRVTRVEVVAHSYEEDETGSIEVGGKHYTDTQSVFAIDNPDRITSDAENVKKVSDATLVSPDIGLEVAQRVYDFYLRAGTISAKIVYDGEKLGDLVSIDVPWDGPKTGFLSKMEMTLSNIVAYKAEANCEL